MCITLVCLIFRLVFGSVSFGPHVSGNEGQPKNNATRNQTKYLRNATWQVPVFLREGGPGSCQHIVFAIAFVTFHTICIFPLVCVLCFIVSFGLDLVLVDSPCLEW